MTGDRDLRIDSLRGLALCVLMVSHLNFDIFKWVWNSLGHTSFAELFVFMSGLVSGIVYWKLLNRTSAREVRARAGARAKLIYFTYLGLVVYITVYTHTVRSLGIDFIPWRGTLLVEDPALTFALAPFFIYQPGFSDVLPMYCIFMLLVPVVLPQIQRGRQWIVLAASVGLWIAAQQGAFPALMKPFIHRFGVRLVYFDPFAWQILFVFGLWFGARHAAGRPVRLPKSHVFAWALVPPLLVSFAIRHQIFFDASVAEAAAAITHRHNLDALRLLNFAALAYLGVRISEQHPAWFEWRWLAYLGQHSLQVFSYSVAAAYLGWTVAGDATIAGQLAFAALAITSLTLPAWVHVRYRARSTARVESAG
ncbi:MAG: OpgC domain-containing protein [Deltaproteobacteria bacterium]|nr:OpgC domain-containing protein [Deltaproteobacteria bacterium]